MKYRDKISVKELNEVFALGGLSTKDLSEKGFGLYSLRKISEKVKGKMIVKTGKAKVTIKKNKISFKKKS